MIGRLRARLRRGLDTYARACWMALRSLRSDRMHRHAYALTFQTMVAIVPLIAVVFSILKAFGGLSTAAEALQKRIFENLAPGTASDVSQYIWTFVDRTSTGAVGGVGIVFLIWAALSLVTSIEKSFNALWNIDRGRNFFQRLVIYWSLVTVGPVLLGLSVAMTTTAQAGGVIATDGVQEANYFLVPWLLTCVSMTLLYLVMPNTRVRIHAALGGGFLAGTAWELAKLVFAWLSRTLFSYDAIYGSLGVLPVFLLWLQVGWIIVLLGAKVTYATQYAEALRNIQPVKEIGQRLRELLAVVAMVQVVRAHRRGDPPPTSVNLAATSGAPVEIEQRVLNHLVHAGFLVRVADCESMRGACENAAHAHGRRKRGGLGADEEGYLPARDGARITVQDMLDAFRTDPAADGDVEQTLSRAPLAVRVREMLEHAEEASSSISKALTLAELVDQLEPQVHRRGLAGRVGHELSGL